MAVNGESNGKWLPVVGDLPHGWEVAAFGEVLDGGTRNGIYKKKEFHGRGAKIVNMGELFAHPRMFDVEMKRVEITDKEIEKSSLQAGDLLFARRSLVAEGAGKCSIVCEVNEPTTFESSIIRARPDATRVDSLFLYYLFNSPFGRYSLDTIRRTVAVSGITGSDLVMLDIPVPPLAEQKAIAEILGALDAKIELNRRMNETLESMARALFKSWFVDFDPVRAKMDGRQPPGLPPATAALFPDSFEHQNGQLIPTGWRLGPLSDLAATERHAIAGGPFGSKLSRKHYAESGVPVIRGANMNGTSGWFNDRNYVFVSNEKAETLSTNMASPGDVVFTQRGTLGQVALIPHDASFPKYVISQSQMKMTCAEGVPGAYVFLYFDQPSTVAYILANATASGVPHINLTFLREFPVLIPDRSILRAFGQSVEPLVTTITANERESETLAALRDTLLPRLLSGELRVADVENTVEALT